MPPLLAVLAGVFVLGRGPVDLVIRHAHIWSDGKILVGDSIAVIGGRIAYVGPYESRWIDPSTKVIDVKGRFVIPGLIDCHTHFGESGSNLLLLQLRDVGGRKEFIRRIANAVGKLGPGEWLQGSGWSTESWPDPAQPRKEWVDGISSGHPICLERMDGHSVFVNSEALRLAGITKDGPPDPPGGVIERDPVTHEPTGVLRDTAISFVEMKLPSGTRVRQEEGLRLAIREANSHGVTTVCDIGNDLTVYGRVYRKTTPTLRFFLYLVAGDGYWDNMVAALKRFTGVPGFVEARGVKAFMDGSMGSRTAFMHDPFANPGPNHPADFRGVERSGAKNGNYARGIALAARSGLQVIVHAIGDQANHDILDLFENNAPGLAAKRFRVEHAQHLLPDDVARFGNLGVIPSMQPLHKADDGRYAEEVVGKERCRTSYAYRSLLRSGANLVFGSDWPVVSCDPFLGIDAAVTGRTMKGDVWFPEQNISVDEALKSYTSRAAYSFFMENELGQIKPGYRADLVVLSESPFANGVKLGKIHPVRVFVEGRDATVYGK
ncbi:MAG: amidohydrolase [Fimbriimonas sp.]|nr:amidohydrolase [Fimbriimonas sp.]